MGGGEREQARDGPSTMDNIGYIEALHALWRQDHGAVDPSWDAFFAAMGEDRSADVPAVPGTPRPPSEQAYRQSRVDSLLWAYRDVGYLYAALNPLGDDHSSPHGSLEPEGNGAYERLTPGDFGLAAEDLGSTFYPGSALGPDRAPLREIIQAFRETYCAHIGVEFLHIQNKRIRRWLIQHMESCRNRPNLDSLERRIFLEDLLRVEQFERFLGTHFVGQKRFSLEGAEAVVPALHFLVNWGATANRIEEICIGTSHRGRLSLLHLILGMTPEEIFSEFEESCGPGVHSGSGDVKYHIGYQSDHVHEDGSTVRVSVAANPSHLESVDPVVQGKVRALQDRGGDDERRRVLPVLIHGDAAFSGQGVVAETLNLSQLQGYKTGGTIHIVINNQIGFTTPAGDARSSFFPTDGAKVLPVPIFHVNGDHPESIIHTMNLALTFRQEFHQDVVIDMFCFRRHGHSEGDEPSFTNPLMYRTIRRHPGAAVSYGRQLDAEGAMTAAEQDRVRSQVRSELKDALDRARSSPSCRADVSQGPEWDGLGKEYSSDPVETGVDGTRLRAIADRLAAVPEGFSIHPKLARILEAKRERLAGDGTLDWAFAEALAFGSLLLEGHPVRLSGEDSRRGTFAQRHLTWWDCESEEPVAHVPLNALGPEQAHLHAFDSPLSEYAVLGFEYGYSLVRPQALVIWEAQFGDFCNGAQVVIDSYIAAGETRWGRRSGLVLLLPHGHEGQGPDHSSAHVERFLSLCAEDNLQVCNPTTPAQYFHLLRRQVKRSFRKPLVVLTPKSLLRHPGAVSAFDELRRPPFREVLDDPADYVSARRVLLCSGKTYYDLAERRETTGSGDTALVRLEQLYPFPGARLRDILGQYGSAQDVVWFQEEPQNSGPWSFVRERFAEELPGCALRYVGRPASASKATGHFSQHRREQEALMAEAFGSR